MVDDLAGDPTSFALTLWHSYKADQAGSEYIAAMTEEDFLTVTLPLAFEYHAAIFDRSGRKSTADATYLFFIHLGEHISPFAPSWFALFQGAFDAGAMNRIAWGAVARSIYTRASPEISYGGERLEMYLAGMKAASPLGLMLRDERAHLQSLPDHLTIYRGALAASPEEAARGLSWSLSLDYCRAHLLRRHVHVTNPFCLGGRATTFGRKPLLVSALVPKTSVLAWLGSGDEEVLVDYPTIPTFSIAVIPTRSDTAGLMAPVLGSALKELYAGLGRLALTSA